MTRVLTIWCKKCGTCNELQEGEQRHHAPEFSVETCYDDGTGAFKCQNCGAMVLGYWEDTTWDN